MFTWEEGNWNKMGEKINDLKTVEIKSIQVLSWGVLENIRCSGLSGNILQNAFSRFHFNKVSSQKVY